jgi:hypothetical protein
MTKTLTTETITNLGSYAVANEADINFENEDGAEFIRTTLATLAEHLTYAADPAEGLRYFVEADGAEVAADFDLPDLAHAVADDVASRYAYNGEVAAVWVGVNGWQVEDEVNDLGEGRDTIGRMRVALFVIAERIVWAARAVLNKDAE